MADLARQRASWTAVGRPLVTGAAEGPALVLAEPLSFWGGLDPATGVIIDRHHPQAGECVAGSVLVLRAGRGSSSSSTVLAEALRAGVGPLALVLREPDEIIAVGAMVVELLDGRATPVLQLAAHDHRRLRTGDGVIIDGTGRLTVLRGKNEATPPKRGRRTVPADPATEAAGLLPRHKGI